MKKKIKKELEELPRKTGIYKFYNKNNEILYIGKALNLKSRVSSYFSDKHIDRPHIIPMIPQIDYIETVLTDNEVDALILEAALIKKNQPKYNVMLKDDKSYSWIYISMGEKIPKVKIVRSLNKKQYKKGKFFGPYPNGRATKRLFTYLRNLYPFCACKNDREEKLYYEMGLCPGPNIGKISPKQYKKDLGNLIAFLEGKVGKPIDNLRNKMKVYAENLRFEEAAELRDKLQDLEYLTQKINADAFDTEDDYKKKIKRLKSRRAKRLREEIEIKTHQKIPRLGRIECYDISNIQGKHAYGSMVVANNGELDSDHYRIFRIKTVKQADDYKMLCETLERRLKYLAGEKKNDDESFSSKPDMILIDGGKGQISKLADLVPKDILLLGISKGRKYKRKGGKKKNEYWTRNGHQLHLKNTKILIQLRDEAHRFAIKHYRKRHRKKVLGKE